MNRGFKIIVSLIVLFVLVAKGLKAQDTLDFNNVDKTSYELYQAGKWKELATFAGKAINKDFDYYYLRMRAGIANYELGNYVTAQKHFEKALTFNSGDELVLEYIYYCYVFSFRPEEARWFSKTLPASLVKKLKTDSLSPLAYVIAEGGTKVADSTRLLGNGNYFNLGVSHYVANRLSLYHAATYYGQSFTDGKALTGQYTQLQYYLGATIPVRNNWQVNPGAQVIHKNVLYHIPAAPQPMHPPPPGKPQPPKARDSTSTGNYFIGSITLKKTFEKFDVGVSTTVSSVFGSNQVQHGALVSYSPIKGKKLVIGCNAYLHTENGYINNYVSVIPFLFVNPVKRLCLTASYLNNNGGKNAVENNGYIVNNSSDLTTSRWSGLISVNVTKQLDIYGLYQFENKVAAAQKYVYHYNLFVVGVKIRPSK